VQLDFYKKRQMLTPPPHPQHTYTNKIYNPKTSLHVTRQLGPPEKLCSRQKTSKLWGVKKEKKKQQQQQPGNCFLFFCLNTKQCTTELIANNYYKPKTKFLSLLLLLLCFCRVCCTNDLLKTVKSCDDEFEACAGNQKKKKIK
jgi:hypothetical protein